MTKREFDRLPFELRLQYLKMYQDLFSDSVRKRMDLLPSASALSAMLLVVATFGDNIVPFNTTVKILLSLLLIIIPISLFCYNSDLKTAQKDNLGHISNLLALDLQKKAKQKQTTSQKFIGIFPDVVIYLLLGIIILFIFLIWLK